MSFRTFGVKTHDILESHAGFGQSLPTQFDGCEPAPGAGLVRIERDRARASLGRVVNMIEFEIELGDAVHRCEVRRRRARGCPQMDQSGPVIAPHQSLPSGRQSDVDIAHCESPRKKA
jgi:hypothetical protein